MSFTKEMRDTFSRQTLQMEDALANAYYLLNVSHHNVEKIYASAVQNKIVGNYEKTFKIYYDFAVCFVGGMPCADSICSGICNRNGR